MNNTIQGETIKAWHINISDIVSWLLNTSKPPIMWFFFFVLALGSLSACVCSLPLSQRTLHLLCGPLLPYQGAGHRHDWHRPQWQHWHQRCEHHPSFITSHEHRPCYLTSFSSHSVSFLSLIDFTCILLHHFVSFQIHSGLIP